MDARTGRRGALAAVTLPGATSEGAEAESAVNLGFVVMHEVFRDVRPPGIKRILRGVIARRPVDRRRDVVDIGGIFGKAAPGILDVVEVIRAQHMTAQAPALGKALAQHVDRASPDFVDRADVPAEMMMAGSIGARERDHVMIAAMDAVKESDVIAGMVR